MEEKPFVRCKDCKYSVEVKYHCVTDRVCLMLARIDCVVKDDDYCSRGEKRKWGNKVSKKEPETIAGIPIERAITILELWKENGSVPEIINYADGFEQGYKTRDKEYAKSFDTMIKIMEKKNETV